MMIKILYMPLDERPCNYCFPSLLSLDTDIELIVPPIELLGNKKEPADIEKLWVWLNDNISDCKCAILSIDMLLYGGIVPSRLHTFNFETCINRLNKLKNIKFNNPGLKMFAFNLIMRCPKYSSSDEEPEYYGEYGENIFKKKYLEHKIHLGLADEEETDIFSHICIPDAVLRDFEARRCVNMHVNLSALNLLKENIIDFLLIPQDDSAPFGYTALEQNDIRKKIMNLELIDQVYMYPGADEVGCTLLARFINRNQNLIPKIHLKFSASKAPYLIPLYEDRILLETVKYHILAAGGIITDSYETADISLLINCPGSNMLEASEQFIKTNSGYDTERNLSEFCAYAEFLITHEKKNVVIADSAYANGGDISLFNILKNNNLLFKLGGYAGWNTNGNTLGTTIANGMIYNIYGRTYGHINFLALRYVEDIGYCSITRWDVTKNYLPTMGLDYFNVAETNGEVSDIIMMKLNEFCEKNFINNYKVLVIRSFLPWKRMFEADIKLKVVSKLSSV